MCRPGNSHAARRVSRRTSPAMSHGAEDAAANLQAGVPASGATNLISECPKCGTKMPASRPSDRCPVCQLRGALGADTEPDLTEPSAREDDPLSETEPVP